MSRNGRSPSTSPRREYSRDSVAESDDEEDSGHQSVRKVLAGSPNVKRVMLYNCLDGIAFSVWNVSVVQLLIYRIGGNSNDQVGWVSGITGVAQVLAALVGSYYADKGKRETITWAGAFCGFGGVVCSVLAAYFETLWLFYASGVLWGYYMGFAYPASEALFADSVASGQRTTIYSYKWALGTVSYVFGYAINMALFFILGNHWSNDVIKIVLYCGLALNPLSFLMLMAVRDKHSLGKESDSLLGGGKNDGGEANNQSNGRSPTDKNDGRYPSTLSSPRSPPRGATVKKKIRLDIHDDSSKTLASSRSELLASKSGRSLNYSMDDDIYDGDDPNTRRSSTRLADAEEDQLDPSDGRRNPRLSKGYGGTAEDDLSDDESEGAVETEDGTHAEIDWSKRWLCFRAKHVPFLLVTADFVSALGAGMTIRFFPLFFINVYNVAPALLNGMYVVTMIVTSLTATGIQRLAKTNFGRVPAMMLVRFLGAGALYYLAVARGELSLMGIMLGVWVFRNSMMNSPLGLSRSVIMDHVPKNQRTKWNAVESFSSFTWAGSAVVGGYLVDAHGYQFTFAITATCQLVGCLIIFPTVFLTRKIDLASAKKFRLEQAKEKRKKERKKQRREEKKKAAASSV